MWEQFNNTLMPVVKDIPQKGDNVIFASLSDTFISILFTVRIHVILGTISENLDTRVFSSSIPSPPSPR